MSLPQPVSEAQIASCALLSIIRKEIHLNGGWLSFERYMELALYAPQLGYYTGGAAKLGSAGDFTTAPELSPLFGAALANFVLQIVPQMTNQIMEFGAGTGKLALDMLTELHHQHSAPDRYYIVELSGELRSRQEQLLRHFPEVVWLEQMPSSFSGLVIGNEVLDAMPVKLVKKTKSHWNEIGVGWQEDCLVWSEKTLNDVTLLKQIPHADALPEGYITELHVTASGFMGSVADMLRKHPDRAGLALFIDYGFPAAEYYLDQRTNGTLMCHYRHHSHTEPFFWPGLQDITSHVDFSAMRQAGEMAGLDLLCYTSQAAFLLNSGIGDLLLRISPEEPLRYLPAANALKKLVSPAEMGELFKVLLMGINVALPDQLGRYNRHL